MGHSVFRRDGRGYAGGGIVRLGVALLGVGCWLRVAGGRRALGRIHGGSRWLTI
jgi:hypothetical protein